MTDRRKPAPQKSRDDPMADSAPVGLMGHSPTLRVAPGELHDWLMQAAERWHGVVLQAGLKPAPAPMLE